MQQVYLESVRKLLGFYKDMVEKAVSQLNDEQLHQTPDDESNGIAVIMKHLAGNMLSRWTDFLNSDGEKSWRRRDEEFIDTIKTRQALFEYWEKGWATLFEALNSVTPDNVDTTIYIRNEPHSVMDAINRQLTHYAYHAGQIVYLAKHFKGSEWISLSIPKGESETFNRVKGA